jgi:hypothetical protein
MVIIALVRFQLKKKKKTLQLLFYTGICTPDPIVAQVWIYFCNQNKTLMHGLKGFTQRQMRTS